MDEAETETETVAMTYAELARRRGISVLSARRLVIRKKWRKEPGNDRTARVWVPIDLAGEVDRAPVPTPREMLEWALSRADRAEARADAAERRVEELRQEFLMEIAAQRQLTERLAQPWWVRWRSACRQSE